MSYAHYQAEMRLVKITSASVYRSCHEIVRLIAIRDHYYTHTPVRRHSSLTIISEVSLLTAGSMRAYKEHIGGLGLSQTAADIGTACCQ